MATRIHTGFTSAWGFRCSSPKTLEARQCQAVMGGLRLSEVFKIKIVGYIPLIGTLIAWFSIPELINNLDSNDRDGRNNIYHGLIARNIIGAIPVLGGLINLIGDLAMSAIRSLPCVDGGGPPRSRNYGAS